ncbi:GNAT family N-acetyltransferase [Piscibacillus halophilus]|uniref:Acetyltransferase (GNAT) family protein n=1 Tax=Piscibacillus halophilus TaxID=571933 RepID=A0A1H9MDN0_9BACI|nr:GNAT family N-acetyltransferase [Piscibacillus halophilus]SER21764.1 Acetyltransferase (GNAT) family protein [Piscibacillus halophilus]
MTLENVTLDFYQEEYRPKLKDYHLSEDQSRYTSMPLEAVEVCQKDNTRYPVVVLYNGDPAGFFVLHGWEGVKAYSQNRQAILMRGFSVNSSFQGKGIAKKSLSILDSFVTKHFPDKNEIILAVNHQNTLAQQVYIKSGYIDRGVRVMGRKGELLILHKAL